ncbi:MAG: DMT family transporter [Micrococcales bacterium]
MTNKQQPWLATFIVLATTWGLSFFFIAVSLESFTAVGVAVLRNVLGALALVIWSLVTKQKFVREKSIWLKMLLLGMLLNAFPGLMFALAEQLLDSSLAGILNATTPLFSVLFITLVFRSESITRSQVVGLLLGFIGVLVLFGNLSFTGSNVPLGIALILMATLGYGFSFPYMRRYLANTGYSSTSLATAQLVASVVLLSPLAITQPLLHSALTSNTAICIFVLGALGTGFAYVWNFRVTSIVGSAIASTVTYLSPVVAVIAGWAILNEAIQLSTLLGAAIILFSAAIVQKRIKPETWFKKN